MKAFYKEYLDKVPELFLVAEDEGKVIGLCMGYYVEDNNYVKSYFKHNIVPIFFRCLFLAITFNKAFYKKVFKRKNKEEARIINPEIMAMEKERTGDLLSICVLPDYRGKGAAQSLMERYLETMKKQGRECCFLSVEESNARAIAFYKRNGFAPYRQKGVSITCARML